METIKDTIYREDAIKEIKEYIVKENEAISEHPDDIFKYNSGLLTAIQVVHDLPSADRPQGEWKHLKEDEWFCSECGHVIWIEGSWEPHPLERGKDYCEHCGARMKGADE